MLQYELIVPTAGPGFYEITHLIKAYITGTGLLSLFIRHTSASLIIQENTDPAIQSDHLQFIARLVPPADDPAMSYLEPRPDGAENLPSHIKAALLPTSVVIPVCDGKMMLGDRQGIFIIEHHNRASQRKIFLHMGG